MLETPEGRLPAPVEASVYFVVSEALTNVAKHADASSAAVRISAGDGVLTVEVADDGAGGADMRGGTGLSGLADRVAALDGELTVTSVPGAGTTVHAEIPLPGCGSRPDVCVVDTPDAIPARAPRPGSRGRSCAGSRRTSGQCETISAPHRGPLLAASRVARAGA